MLTPIEVVQSVLRERFDVGVFAKVPRDRPGTFIRVDQGAPSMLSPVHQRVLVIVQVYAPDVNSAVDLAYQVRSVLEDLDAHHSKVFGVEDISGPMEFPDPDLQNVARWQVTGYMFMALG